MSDEFTPGATIDVAHPFTWEEVNLFGETTKSWRPGIYYEIVQLDGGSGEPFADGIGSQTLTIVAVFKPGRFPTRVFFTRQWTDPVGKQFGKPKLHIMVVGAFRRMIRGYRVPYVLKADKAAAA